MGCIKILVPIETTSATYINLGGDKETIIDLREIVIAINRYLSNKATHTAGAGAKQFAIENTILYKSRT